MSNPKRDIPNDTKEDEIMRDIATASLSGNLTREVELRPLPSGTEVARLRVASGTRRRSGEEWIERTNYFTVEVYGKPRRHCGPYAGTPAARAELCSRQDGAASPAESHANRVVAQVKARSAPPRWPVSIRRFFRCEPAARCWR